MRTTKIDKVSTETTLEVRDTNKCRDTIRETNTTSTDMTITKTETGLITEEDQTNYIQAGITYNLSLFQDEARTRPTDRTSRNKPQHEYA